MSMYLTEYTMSNPQLASEVNILKKRNSCTGINNTCASCGDSFGAPSLRHKDNVAHKDDRGKEMSP